MEERVITIGGTRVLSLLPQLGRPAAVIYRAGFAVDVDGAPDAYGPNNSGLDYTANAGHPRRTVKCETCAGTGELAQLRWCDACRGTGNVIKPANWWGVETVSGAPDGVTVIQGPDDPAPFFYVSATALVNPAYQRTDPRRYVNASVVPYASVPPAVVALGARVGDVAVVCLESTDGYRASAAIIADVGPKDKIGEGSPALAQVLGLPASPRNGGTSKAEVVWVLFPGSRSEPKWPRDNKDVQAQAEALFTSFGGYAAACMALSSL